MRSSSPRCLDAVHDSAVLCDFEALERKRRTGAVPDETLSAEVVVFRDADGSVEIEASVGRREASFFPFVGGAVDVGLGLERPSLIGSARKRDVRKSVERCPFARIVATLFGRTLIEIAMSTKPDDGSVVSR